MSRISLGIVKRPGDSLLRRGSWEDASSRGVIGVRMSGSGVGSCDGFRGRVLSRAVWVRENVMERKKSF